MRILFLIIFALFFSCSCSDENKCLRSPGNERTFTKNVNRFNKLSVKSIFDIILVDSSAYSISITAGENIIPLIKHEIIDGELILENTYNCTWLSKAEAPKIVITAPQLNNITIHDACNISSIDTLHYENVSIECWAKIFNADLTMNCDRFFFKANSTTGDYILKGNCRFYAFFYNVGTGYLNADQFRCSLIDLIHESLGDTRIYATNRLYVERIKYGQVHLVTDICPEIQFVDQGNKEHFFTPACLY